jgi:cobyrinic acid a,c-diamide synthase
MGTARVLVSATGGGGGKTLVAVGLARAWTRQGRVVAPFKKGPDYIDAEWLTRAAGVACRNLDLFLMPADAAVRSFASSAAAAELAVIEGNRGLYDGSDGRGTYSSAELAKLLSVPVLLVVDGTKTTRTAAAVVLGCQRLDPDVDIGGVVLNRVAGRRHESVLREAIEAGCGVPVLGSIPRLEDPPFPERHLGLVPPQEHAGFDHAVDGAADLVEAHLDLDRIRELASRAAALNVPARPARTEPASAAEDRPRIGIFRDAAFQFYYAENLEALEREGAQLVEISPLRDTGLPDVDALYIGGGFPETLAAGLARNTTFRATLRESVEDGLPIYAECGGAVYLGEELHMDGAVFPMAGAMPATYGFGARPNGHGYAVLESVQPNPFFDVGETFRGHEFHYTFLESAASDRVTFAFRVHRGHGFDGEHDGLCYRNVLAAYTHLHALGVGSWARSLVGAAVRRRQSLAALERVP